MAAYQWKLQGLYPIDAQDAGEELDRIYDKFGSLKPEYVVNESRSRKSPLHDCFEWDDEVAAESYRKEQARHLICNVAVIRDDEDKPIAPTRAYVHASSDYHPISIVLKSRDMTEELLDDAFREMRSFQEKYSSLQKLAHVMDAMDEAMEG